MWCSCRNDVDGERRGVEYFGGMMEMVEYIDC